MLRGWLTSSAAQWWFVEGPPQCWETSSIEDDMWDNLKRLDGSQLLRCSRRTMNSSWEKPLLLQQLQQQQQEEDREDHDYASTSLIACFLPNPDPRIAELCTLSSSRCSCVLGLCHSLALLKSWSSGEEEEKEEEVTPAKTDKKKKIRSTTMLDSKLLLTEWNELVWTLALQSAPLSRYSLLPLSRIEKKKQVF